MPNLRTSNKGIFLRGGVRRRETFWLGIPRASDTMATSATAVLSSTLNAAALALAPFTIVRSRGMWLTHSDQVAASESWMGNLGMAVVSAEASAVGITAVPTPATNIDSDLFYLIEQWPGQFVFSSSVGFPPYVIPRIFDSRAMRKVEPGQDIAIVKEAGIGGSGVVIDSVGRILVKLH